MGKTLISALRFIAGVLVGYGVFYMWNSIRVEDDQIMSIGVGVISAILVFSFLHFSGGGSSN